MGIEPTGDSLYCLPLDLKSRAPTGTHSPPPDVRLYFPYGKKSSKNLLMPFLGIYFAENQTIP